MALMLSKTYDALLAARAPEDKARDAAEEIAAYENRLSGIETRLGLIELEIRQMKEVMATKQRVLGIIVTQTFAILGGVAGLLKLLH
jgi:hypothetical protein